MKKASILMVTVIIILLTAVFTLQNAQVIIVNFFFWSFEASLSLILFVTYAIGLFSAIVGLLPTIIFRKETKNGLNNKIEQTPE
jgi:uncharacterized integral membrane protein